MGCNCGGTVVEAVKNGIVGLFKAATGRDPTPISLLELRIRACVGHPTNDETKIKRCPRNGAGLICLDCGCMLAAKQRVKSSECPRGDWPDKPLNADEQIEWAKKLNAKRP